MADKKVKMILKAKINHILSSWHYAAMLNLSVTRLKIKTCKGHKLRTCD
jgi:hypothetical protein